MNKVSSYTAVAQSDIAAATALIEKQILDYTMSLYNTGDSIWITILWPGGAQIAFRAAFAYNSTFVLTRITDHDHKVLLEFATALGSYQITVSLTGESLPLLHYKTSFKAYMPVLLPYSPRDIVPLTQKGQSVNTTGKIHNSQIGTRSGILFASMTRPANVSLFYFQNLSALSAFCDSTKTSLAGTVGGQWPEMGFQLPAVIEEPVPDQKTYILSDAYVLLSDVVPADEIGVATQYLDHLAAVYSSVPKPPTKYHDWQQISRKALRDLTNNKGCWSYAGGHTY